MRRVAIIFFIGILFCGCAAYPSHYGGRLFISNKTPKDNSFVVGNYEYVRNNLEIVYYVNSARISSVVIEYVNRGEEAVSLKVVCRWSAGGENYISSAKQYEALLLPYSRYIIRERAMGMRTGLVFSCDHMETLIN